MFDSDKTTREGGGDHYDELTSGRPVLHAEGQFVECHFSTSQFVPFRRVGKRQLKEILREAVANDSPRHSCKQKRFKVFQDSLGIPDSTYWIVESGFRIPIVRGILCSLNLIPKPRVLESKSNNFPDSGNWTPSLGWLLRQKVVIFLKQLFAMLSVLLPKKKTLWRFSSFRVQSYVYESSIFILKVIIKQ